jgi:hypothetical protein
LPRSSDRIAGWPRCPARFNLGVVLGNLGRREEARAALEAVIAVDAGHTDAWNSLGLLAAAQGDEAEAVRCFEQVIAIQPEHAQAHHNLGLSRLRQGDYARGFRALEWRWRTPGFTPFEAPQPRWDGRPQPEQTLLVHTEQGAGDCFQMARFLTWAAQRVKRLVLAAPSDLQAVLASAEGVAEVIGPGPVEPGRFDCWVPMMSLPLLYGLTPATIPAAPAYLRAPKRSQLRLPPAARPRVGIVWAGSPTHGRDQKRSSRLVDWRPILDCPEIDCISLQKGEAA